MVRKNSRRRDLDSQELHELAHKILQDIYSSDISHYFTRLEEAFEEKFPKAEDDPSQWDKPIERDYEDVEDRLERAIQNIIIIGYKNGPPN